MFQMTKLLVHNHFNIEKISKALFGYVTRCMVGMDLNETMLRETELLDGTINLFCTRIVLFNDE